MRIARLGPLLCVIVFSHEASPSEHRPQAHTLSTIAECDWPDEYPELLNNLVQLLSSGSPNAIHGAMQMFTDFVKSELTEDQLLPTLRQLLPILLNILGDQEVRIAPRCITTY